MILYDNDISLKISLLLELFVFHLLLFSSNFIYLLLFININIGRFQFLAKKIATN